MGIHIAKPRLMLAVIAVLAATAATLTFAIADDARPPQHVIVPIGPTNVELPVVSDTERATAEDSVRRNERVKAVLGDISWTGTVPAPASRRFVKGGADEEIGAGFNLVLSSPVESSGPWLINRCRGTRQVEGFFPFSEIRTVNVIVAHDGLLLQFIPDDAVPGDSSAGPSLPGPVIIDLLSGKELWRGRPGQEPIEAGEHWKCPEGLNDD